MRKRRIMKRKLQYYYLRRIYKLLRSGGREVVFVRMKKYRGLTNFSEWIKLDPDNEILSTTVHECLHCLYPKWHGNRINSHEEKIFFLMSHKQITNLLKYLVMALSASPNNRQAIRLAASKKQKKLKKTAL